jgi:alginate O-acetyltransferase complex protein AlgJ
MKESSTPPAFISRYTTPALALALFLSPSPGYGDSEKSDDFAAVAAKAAAAAQSFSVPGAAKGWYFLKSELRQVGLGKFWEQPWADVVSNPGKEDPIPYMVEFKDALAEKGVELLVVPIPMKASIYPDQFDADFGPGDPFGLRPLYEKMRGEGLDVLDLEPILAALRATGKLYCEQDAHYSPRACEIIAASLAKKIKAKDWADSLAAETIVRSEPTEIQITGDLVVGTDFANQTSDEVLKVLFAGHGNTGSKPEPVKPDPSSPILLFGDSHTLVFQEGSSTGMHCHGAGLLDQLQFELQSRIDHYGQKGSGTVQARKALYGKVRSTPDFWEGKKMVIWVFSSREFTQSTDKLLSIPIEPK